LDAGAEAFKERGIEVLFELADLGANGGLCAETGLCGLGEALEADNFEERVKLVEVHGRLAKAHYKLGPLWDRYAHILTSA
jgi:hypothetical protein